MKNGVRQANQRIDAGASEPYQQGGLTSGLLCSTYVFLAHTSSITEENARGGFRGAGLMPLDPEAVISKLDFKFKDSNASELTSRIR